MSSSCKVILVLADYHTSLFNAALLIGIISVISAKLIPKLNGLLKYGKTLDVGSVTKWKWLYVPKSWFLHFYILDLTWALSGLLLIGLKSSRSSIILLFNFVQASRRIYECAYVSKFAEYSKIHLSHYLAGILFYTIANLQIIAPHILANVPDGSETTVPQWSALLASSLFMMGSIDQFVNHCHLANLKKYTAPSFGLFRYVVCAHYFDEILIYLAEYVILQNSTSFLIVIWVIVNLGTSAYETRSFYTEKRFLVGPYIMIPMVW
ncbi:BA75_00701T0 [Komagataella pastoris]|uniref:Polyprenal reductase n=1 Tax=Komagataella pastoris TaxID=4922 RepID=A0A1B2J6W6_PICPA|nr:BA75_00701T0 [Komagataella pastoris]